MASPGSEAAPANYHDYLPDDMADIFGLSSGGGPSASQPRPDGTEALGIDEEVAVAKRVREPRVKLDESRLLSDQGIPALRQRAKVLKLKGKGHEFSDAARLLSLYQLWLDDLFPKARFGDALAMVEKEGHKASMHKARMEWINEAKPGYRPDADADWDWTAPAEGLPDLGGGDGDGPGGGGNAPDVRDHEDGPHDTGDVPGDDDLLELLQSPPRSGAATAPALQHRPAPAAPDRPDEPDVPDDDILEALMAEAGA